MAPFSGNLYRNDMPAPEPQRLLRTLQDTLASQGVDYDATVAEFGQVQASEERDRGKQFTLADHLRGLVLSLLSNQRPWGPIAANLEQIQSIFFGFNAARVRGTDPDYLVQRLRALRCGNRQIRAQMRSLAENIDTLGRVESDYGSLDRFVTSADPDAIATKLSAASSRYKLKQVGYTLALEYLRNVGVRASKPDVHVRRAIGAERLGYFEEYPTEEQAYRVLGELADGAGINPTYLDNLLWLFCAKNYGDVCRAKPRCEVCGFVDTCNYPPRYRPDLDLQWSARQTP